MASEKTGSEDQKTSVEVLEEPIVQQEGNPETKLV